jgi:hypothetical protein
MGSALVAGHALAAQEPLGLSLPPKERVAQAGGGTAELLAAGIAHPRDGLEPSLGCIAGPGIRDASGWLRGGHQPAVYPYAGGARETRRAMDGGGCAPRRAGTPPRGWGQAVPESLAEASDTGVLGEGLLQEGPLWSRLSQCPSGRERPQTTRSAGRS